MNPTLTILFDSGTNTPCLFFQTWEEGEKFLTERCPAGGVITVIPPHPKEVPGQGSPTIHLRCLQLDVTHVGKTSAPPGIKYFEALDRHNDPLWFTGIPGITQEEIDQHYRDDDEHSYQLWIQQFFSSYYDNGYMNTEHLILAEVPFGVPLFKYDHA